MTFSGASASPNGSNPTVTNATGTAVNFGSNTAITFTNGVATVTGSNNGVMTLYKVGAASIVVSDGTINNGTGLAVTVGVGNAAGLSLSAASTTPAAGAGDNLTITAVDALRQHGHDLHRFAHPDLQRGQRHRHAHTRP